MPHTCQFLSGFTCFGPKLLEFIATMITSHHCSPRRFLQARCRKWVWSQGSPRPHTLSRWKQRLQQRPASREKSTQGLSDVAQDIDLNSPWFAEDGFYFLTGQSTMAGNPLQLCLLGPSDRKCRYVKTKSLCRYWWYCVMVLGTAWQKHLHSMPVQRGRRHPSPISPPSHAASNCCHSLAMPCTWRLGDRHCWTFHGCACNARCCFKMLPLLVSTSRVHWPLWFPLVSWCMNSMNSSHSPAPKLQEL